MILYCDTSALVKFYFQETYTKALQAHRQTFEAVAISVVGYTEFFSAMNRKKREGHLDIRACRRLTKLFDDEWLSFVKLNVTDEINKISVRLLSDHSLRAFDAIHLASALLLKNRLRESEVQFASLDDRQRHAGEQEGFVVIPTVKKARARRN